MAALQGFALLPACGHSPKATLPEMYPAGGKVVYSQGGSVAGGAIVFQPQNDATVSTTGEIRPDGSFTLYSFKAGVRAAGAIAGPHRVIVTFLLEKGRKEMPHSVLLPDICTIQPCNNELTLTVPGGINKAQH